MSRASAAGAKAVFIKKKKRKEKFLRKIKAL
jgi:hypothetical protein